MKLVVIIGPQAVGKMTVGQELEKVTGLKLFHNHASIELVHPLFSYGTATGKKLVRQIRESIFRAMAASDQAGLIFTYVWFFDCQEDADYLHSLTDIFRKQGADICYVELEAGLEERLRRNRHEHRLHHKPSKRDLDYTGAELVRTSREHRLNSLAHEFDGENYLRINNEQLAPEKVAGQIREYFGL